MWWETWEHSRTCRKTWKDRCRKTGHTWGRMGEHLEAWGRRRGLGARHGVTQVAGGLGSHSGDTLASLGKCPQIAWGPTSVPVPQPVVGKGTQGDVHTSSTSSPFCPSPPKKMCDRTMPKTHG